MSLAALRSASSPAGHRAGLAGAHRALLVLGAVLAAAAAIAAPQLGPGIAGYTVVSSTPTTTPGVNTYVVRVALRNSGTVGRNVTAQFVGAAGTTVQQGTAHFGDLWPGEAVYSADTLTVVQGAVFDPTGLTLQTYTEGALAGTPPHADAGPNQVVIDTQKVVLDGSRSTDPAGNPLSYSWRVVSVPAGSKAALSSATAVRPTFTADVVGSYAFELTVSDGVASSAPAQVTVQTTPALVPPVAHAGADQVATAGGLVALDGTASTDLNGLPLAYNWAFLAKPAGSAATLAKATGPQPTFVADLPGAYVVGLTVSDSQYTSALAATVVTVRPTTLVGAPVAAVGRPQAVTVRKQVILDGTPSRDPGGAALNYRWTLLARPAGSTATLTNATTFYPILTPDVAGVYVAQLIANNGSQDSRPVVVAVTTVPAAVDLAVPYAVPGADQTVQVGTLASLDGSQSTDPAGAPLSYAWSLVLAPNASKSTIVPTNAPQATLLPDAAGLYIGQLAVGNGFSTSDPQTLRVQAVPPPVKAVNDSAYTQAATAVAIPVLLNDSGGQGALSVQSVFLPLHGTALVSGTQVVYTPFAGYTGVDQFPYTATDGVTSSTAIVTVTVAAALTPQTISFTTIPTLTVGNGGTVIATATSALPVTLTAVTPATCALAGNTVTGLQTGTCTIVANQAGNATFATAPQASLSVTVGPGKTVQSVSFTLLPTALTVGGTGTLGATANSGLAVAFASASPATCSVSGTTVTGIAAGVCSVTASQPGNATYAPAPVVTEYVKVGLNAQTIKFTSVPTLTVGASGTVTATASSGLPVTLGTTTGAICSVTGQTVTALANGSCTVTANQAGNATWAAAPQATQAIAVKLNAQSIAFTLVPSVDVGTSGTLAATASSGLTVSFGTTTPTICQVSGTTVTGVAAGTCTVSASQAGNAYWAAATTVTATVTVAGGIQLQTVQFGAVPVLRIGGSATLAASASSGLAVTLSSLTPQVCTVTGATVTAVAAGNCVVAGDQPGSTGFAAAPQATATVPVLAAPLLYAFGGTASDGQVPVAALVQANDGNFYGATGAGGAYGFGTVFRLTPAGVETVLYSFGQGTDGQGPGASLVQGADGALYGTTTAGGVYGAGTVYRITLAGAESVLYSFGAAAGDGYLPQSALVLASDGNFYGTTTCGGVTLAPPPGSTTPCGDGSGGTVFRVTPAGIETPIYAFGSRPAVDGYAPSSALIQAGNGLLYGTTTYSTGPGAIGGGTVYSVSTAGTEAVVYEFGASATDGKWPQGPVVQGADGNFYGTTQYGGGGAYPRLFAAGTVFRVTPAGVETVLYSFGQTPADGAKPLAGLVRGSDGNFYGTTYHGGDYTNSCDNGSNGCGTIFRITPAGVKTQLYALRGPAFDGARPSYGGVGLVQGLDGNLYGTTLWGGPYPTINGLAGFVQNAGTAFRISPTGAAPAAQTITYGAAPVLAVGGSAALAATASSGLPVAIRSFTPAVCSYSAGQVSAVAPGLCVLMADQAGNASFAAAPEAELDLCIGASGFHQPSCEFTPATNAAGAAWTYGTTAGQGGALMLFDQTGTRSRNGVVVQLWGSATQSGLIANNSTPNTFVGGIAAIRPGWVSLVADASQYTTLRFTAPVAGTYALSLDFQAANFILLGGGALSTQVVVRTATSTLYSGSIQGYVEVGQQHYDGTVALTAGQTLDIAIAPDTQQLGFALNVTGSVALRPTPGSTAQSIAFKPPASVVNGASAALAAAALSALPVTFSTSTPSICAVAGGAVRGLAPGSCVVTATQGGSASFQPVAVTQTIAITAGSSAQSITFTSIPTIRVGTSGTLSATASSGLGVSFSSLTPATCTVVGYKVTGVTAGTCTVAADQGGSAAYLAAPEVRTSFSVGTGTTAQSITFGPAPAISVGGTGTVTATASSGLAVVFASQTPATCTVTGGTVSGVAGGTCTIAANQPGSATYAPAPQATLSFTIGTALTAQSIAFTPPASVVAGGTTTLSATATSGLTVAFAAAPAAVCTITAGNTLNALTAGSCAVTASQAGNATYAAATPVTQAVTVTLAPQSITFNPAASVAAGTTTALSATASSGLAVTFAASPSAVCTITAGNSLNALTAGSCAVTASQAGNATYAAATPVTQTVTVTLAPQTITFSPPASVVAAGTTTLSATASSGLTVTFAAAPAAVCTITAGNALNALTAGSCTVTASQAGNATYAAATPVAKTVTVTLATQSIAFTPPASVVAGSTATLAATATSGLAVAFAASPAAVCTITAGTTLNALTAGSCAVTASQPGNATYAAASPVTQTVTISPVALLPQTITFTPPASVVAAGTTTLSATATSGLTVTFAASPSAVCTITSGNVLNALTAGSCAVTASQAGNATYAAATPVAKTVTVTLAPQSIAFTPPASMVAGSTTTLAATASSGLAVAFAASPAAVCTITGGNTLNALTAGSCSVTASQAGNATYAAVATSPQIVPVTLAAQTITFNPASSLVAGTTTALAATASSGLAVAFAASPAAVCTITGGNTLNALTAGSCAVTASQAGNATYAAATPVAKTVTVTLAPQSITFTPPASVVAGTTTALSATASSGLAVAFAASPAAVCTITGSTLNALTAGSCAVTASQPGNATYAAATPVSPTVTVTLAPQSITFTPPASVVAGTTTALSATASSGLAVAFAASPAAVCTITGGNTLNALTAGSCAITASQAGNATYAAATTSPQTVAVTLAPQSIAFTPPASVVAGTTTALSATATSGLAVAFAASPASVCTITGGNVLNALTAGSCAVTASQAGNATYAAATTSPQTITVTLAPQTITFTPPASVVAGSTTVLSATTTSGLTVAFAASPAAVCTITGGNTLNALTAGSCAVTASQAGNATYAAATPVTQTVTVNPAGPVVRTIETWAGRGPLPGPVAAPAANVIPWPIALDGTGRIYFGQHGAVYRYDPAAGTVTPVAGNETIGYSGDGGPATSAQIGRAGGIALDNAGNVYLADYQNYVVRKVTPAGVISTFAGTGVYGSTGDGGPATAAQLGCPYYLRVDATDHLLIADCSFSIRSVDLVTGTISTVPNTANTFPAAVTSDAAGNIYYVVTSYGGTPGAAADAIYKLAPGGAPVQLASTGHYCAEGLAIDAAGTNLYTSDYCANLIFKISTSTGAVTSIAGNSPGGFSPDGTLASAAQLGDPADVAIGADGTVYFTDLTNFRVRKFQEGGALATIVGTNGGVGGLATAASIGVGNPRLKTDSAGNVYTGNLLKIAIDGTLTEPYGNGAPGYGGDGGAAASATFDPTDIDFDAAGNAYVADFGNNRIRKISTTGAVTTIAGNGTYSNTGDGGAAAAATIGGPVALTLDGAGNVYVLVSTQASLADCPTAIRKITPAGVISLFAGNYTAAAGYSGDGGPAISAVLGHTCTLKADAAGNVYLADRSNNIIRKIDTTGTITRFAGTAGSAGYAGDGGAATAALLNSPQGVSADTGGTVYIADRNNHRIRAVSSSGVISTVAGTGVAGLSGDGGDPTLAQLSQPNAVSVDAQGTIYFTDWGNNRIRRIKQRGTSVQTITPGSAPPSLTVGGTTGLAATASSGLAVSYASLTESVCTVTGSVVTAVSGGTCIIAVNQTGNATYATASQQTITISVPLATQSITFGAAPVVTQGTSALLSATASSGLPVSFSSLSSSICTVAGAIVTGVSTGICTIAANQPGDALYAPAAQVTLSFTVAPSATIRTVETWGGRGPYTAPVVAPSANVQPWALAVSPSGSVYFAQYRSIYRYDPATATVTEIAGNEQAGTFNQGDGGPATSAQFLEIFSLALDAAGNLYVADGYNYVVRKITPAGVISNVAGTGVSGSLGNGGAAGAAQLNFPGYLHVDASNNLLIADCGNGIRSVNLTTQVISIVPNTTSTNNATQCAADVTSDAAGNIYYIVTDFGSFTASDVLYKVAPGGSPVALATLHDCSEGLAVDAAGNVYTADYCTNSLYQVSPAGAVTVIGGTGAAGFSPDGTLASAAMLYSPSDVAVDAAGTVYFSDFSNYRLRSFPVGGVLTTIAGTNNGFGGLATYVAANIINSHLATDAAGNLYVDYTAKIAADDTLTRIGTGVDGYGGDGGLVAGASFRAGDVVFDPAGNAYVADQGNHRIRKVTPAGVVSTIAGTGTASNTGDGGPAATATIQGPRQITMDGAGNLYVIVRGSSSGPCQTAVRRITPAGTISLYAGSYTAARGYGGDNGPATAAVLGGVCGLAADPAGNVYLADTNNNRVRKIDTTGTITTIAGTGTAGYGGDGGAGTSALLNAPHGVVYDHGSLHISDTLNSRIRVLSAAGTITTEAGTGVPGFAGDGGSPTAAQFNYPSGLALDLQGTLYVGDEGNSRIRRLKLRGPAVQTIAFGGAPALTLGGSGTLSATASSTLPVVYGSTTAAVCTVAGSTVTALTGGTCVVAANQTGNSTFATAPQVTQTIVVPRAGQSISFGSPPVIAAGGTGTVSATSTASLPVFFSSTTPAVCTIAGSTVTGVTFGTCTIAANQPGNGSIAPAAQVLQTFSIAAAPGPQLITFGAAPVLTVGATATLAATASSGLPVVFTTLTPATCSVSGNTVTGLVANTCVVAANQGGNASFAPAPQVLQSIVVGAALKPQTITFGAAPTVNKGGTGLVVANASSGLPVTLSSSTTGVCTVTGKVVTGVAAGSCVIAANQAGNTTYAVAPTVTQTITIGSGTATQTIVYAAPLVLSVGQSIAIQATATSGLAPTFSSLTTSTCTVSGQTVTGVATGSCTIAANQAGNASFLAAPQANAIATVTLASVRYAFGAAATEGAVPAGVVQGNDHNFYVTTTYGGAYGNGAIYKYVLASSATSLIYSFGGAPGDGANPAAPMIVGSDGNFYGTTQKGGANGAGTVFKMVAGGGPATVLYSFGATAGDGQTPLSALVQASDGNFYGTTACGGGVVSTGNSLATAYCADATTGTVFKLTPAGVETVLHSFASGGLADGVNPTSALIQATDGNLYGVTAYGLTSLGTTSFGTAYKVTLAGVESVLYDFGAAPNDGYTPYGRLAQGNDGNLYGTTINGGAGLYPTAGAAGTVFKLTLAGAESVLYSFGATLADGVYPYGGLIKGSDGNLYGATGRGGATAGVCGIGPTVGCGTVYRITTAGAEAALYPLQGAPYDAWAQPLPYDAPLVQGTDGNFYGVTAYGGPYGPATNGLAPGAGTLFAVANVASPPAAQTITFGAAPTLTVGGSGSVSATASSGLTVALQSATTAVCTLGAGTVTGVAPGLCRITASQSGNASFTAAPPAELDICIAGGGFFHVVCDFSASSNLAGATWSYGSTPSPGGPLTLYSVPFPQTYYNVTVPGWASSTTLGEVEANLTGLPFTYLNSLPSGWAGLLADPAGYATIRFTAPAAGTYAISLDFQNAESIGVGGSPVTAHVTLGSTQLYQTMLLGIIGTGQQHYSGSVGLEVGQTIDIAINPGQAFLSAANVTGSIALVTAAGATAQTITFGAAPTVHAGGSAALAATASSGLPVTFGTTTPATCTVSGSTVYGVAAGTCTIIADQFGNATFAPAPRQIQGFTVLPPAPVARTIETWLGHGPYTAPVAAPSANVLPLVLALGPAGTVYFADWNTVYKYDPVSGFVTEVAGNQSTGTSGDGGPATSATLDTASTGLALDAAGNLYIADQASHTVRRVTPAGTISLFAGTRGTSGTSGDGGPAAAALLQSPRYLHVDALNRLLIGGASGSIRAVDLTDGKISTLASVTVPAGMKVTGVTDDAAGNLYFVESSANSPSVATPDVLYKLAPGGSPVQLATLQRWSLGLALDGAGFLYTADALAGRIYKVPTSGGTATSVAGTGTVGISPDGTAATSARLANPNDVAVDANGTIYFTDYSSGRVRAIVAGGTLTTLAGTNAGAGGLATSAAMDEDFVFHISTDPAGNMVTNDLGQVSPSGVLTYLGGIAGGYAGDGGPVANANFIATQVVYDASGNAYVADSGNYRIRKITSTGIVSTIAGNGVATDAGDGGPAASATLSKPTGIAVDSLGNVYFTVQPTALGTCSAIRQITPAGIINRYAGSYSALGSSGDNGPATSATLNGGCGLSTDAAGNLYVADEFNNRIRRITPAGVITTVAGNGTAGYSGDGGAATTAQLFFPIDVASDAAGNLHIADTVNHRIRLVSTAGVISTEAGTGVSGYSGDGGDPTLAQLSFPIAVALDSAGTLYVNEYGNKRVRRLKTRGTAAQTITFGSVPASVVVGATATVSATSTSGLSVAIASTTSAVCTVSGNTVAAVAVGACVLAANQTGDPTWATAPQVTQTITILP